MSAPDPYDELTIEDLREAIDQARSRSIEKPSSPEFRQWWKERADFLQATLDAREES